MNCEPKRVAMTGSRGFIGTHLTRYLTEKGYEVVPLGPPACSLTDAAALTKFFAEKRPQFLLHLAGLTAPGRDLQSMEAHYASNTAPAITLARVVPPWTSLVLFFGSCEEYGNGPTPFRETQEPISFSPYGWGKISAYHGSMMVARQRNLNFCWLRPFLTFGPGQDTKQLIPTLIRGCLRDEEIPLTSGEQTRDFLYVNDLCRMLEKILLEPQKVKHQVLNVATGTPRSVRSVAQTIQRLVGRGRLLFGHLPYRMEEAMSFYASIEKYRRLYGEPQFTPFEEALQTTIHAQFAPLPKNVETSTILNSSC